MHSNLYILNYKPKDLPYGFRIFASSVRQYFVDNYSHPLFHNHHPDGKSIYRSKGAPFQFKTINNEVLILALNEGVDFACSFQWPKTIAMPLGRRGVLVELELSSKTTKQASFQQSNLQCYRSISPYIALNQHKCKAYTSLVKDERREVIEKCLVDHILTAAKWCGITLNHRIKANLIQMRTGRPIKIKDDLFFIPFNVMFECNTDVPDYIGIGKFVSRGYGTVVKYG